MRCVKKKEMPVKTEHPVYENMCSKTCPPTLNITETQL